MTVDIKSAEELDATTWLYKEKLKRGLLKAGSEEGADSNPLDISYTAGGGLRLEQAPYFWVFTKLMLITAILFIPFSIVYKPRTYLQDESDPGDELHPVKP